MANRNAHPVHHIARATTGLVLSCVAIGLGGCLERTISVTSEPPGAVVWLNDVQVGRTPVEVDFTFYGVYDIRLQREGYEPLATSREAKAPLQETPGIDLLAELWPQRITDRVEWHFVLEPTVAGVASPGEAREALLDRARSLGALLDEK